MKTVITLTELPTLEDMGRIGQPELHISTMKTGRGVIQSCASVGFAMSDGSFVTRFPDDFMYWPKPSQIITRATAKNLELVHNETMGQIEAIKAQAIAHYQAGV